MALSVTELPCPPDFLLNNRILKSSFIMQTLEFLLAFVMVAVIITGLRTLIHALKMYRQLK